MPGTKTGSLFESPPRASLKSGLQPLGRYGTHQETISRKPEQMYTLPDTRLEWLGDGPLFESDSNKRQGAKMGSLFELPSRPLLESDLWPLFYLLYSCFLKNPATRNLTSRAVVIIFMKVLNFGSNILAGKFPVSSLF